MARKREISYFTDINTDEDLEKFLEQDALIILDVYQELLGPCTVGMHDAIGRIKTSIPNSEDLELGSANATKIDKLKRFRGKSLPTMLFCRNGKCVDIVYGSNIPLVTKKVKKHLSIKRHDVVVDDGNDKAGRYYFEFDEMLREEREEFEKQKAIKEEQYKLQRATELIGIYAELDEVIELMKKKASDQGVTIFMPHVAETAFRKTHENSKWCALVNRELKFVQLNPKMMDILNYKLDNPIDEAVLEYIYNKDILMVLWSTASRTPMTKILKGFMESVAEPQPVDDEEGNRLSGVFKPAILLPLRLNADGKIIDDKDQEENERVGIKKSLVIDVDVEKVVGVDDIDDKKESDGNKMGEEKNEDEDENDGLDDTLIIPPMWTPANQAGNAVFMYTFFRNQFEAFLPRMSGDDDPHVCMIFPAKKYEQIFETIQYTPNGGVLAFGFFEGNNFDDFKLICKKTECYENYSKKRGADKLIMKLSKKTSEMVLALAPFGLLHISLTQEDAKDECSKVFNEEFDSYKDVGC